MAIIKRNGTVQNVLDRNVNSKLPNFPLGDAVIYEEQQVCALGVKAILDENKVSGNKFPIVVAQPQQGKTGAILYLTHLLQNDWKMNNVNGSVLILCNVSSNSLLEQTESRVNDAQLDVFGSVNCHHLVGGKYLTNFVKNYKKTPHHKLAVIVDEAHIGQIKDGVFERFMTDLGVEYGIKSPKNISVISVTATPFAHEVSSRLSEEKNVVSNFDYVQLDESPAYFSLNKMFEKGRILQSYPIIEKVKIGNKESDILTEWMAEKVVEFKQECNPNPGYMILRARDNKQATIIGKLLNEEGLPCSIFSSTHTVDYTLKMTSKLSISRLNGELCRKPLVPKVIIIIQAGRVGVTFDTTRFIRMWIDNPNSNGDTNIQAIGRCMGYDDKDFALAKGYDVHSKSNDTFKLYCNVTEVKDAISFYKNPLRGVVPSSTHSSSTAVPTTITRGVGRIVILKSSDEKDAKKELEKLLNAPNVYDTLLALHPKDYGIHTAKQYSVICGKVSDNGTNPYAENLNNFSTRASVVSKGKQTDKGILRSVRIRHVDEMVKDISDASKGIKGMGGSKAEALAYHERTWNEMAANIPEILGKFVYVLSELEYTVLNEMGLLKSHTVLQKEQEIPTQKLSLSSKSSFYDKTSDSINVYGNSVKVKQNATTAKKATKRVKSSV